MLLVILYHSILFWGGDWFTEDPAIVSPLLAGFAKYLNSFHIYAFTLVSGYIFYYIKYEKGQYQQFSAFIKTKAKRLLIPYVLIATVWVVPIQCLFFDYDLQTIVSKYVLATGPSQLWFLLMLFNVFVLFWLLSDFFQKHHLAGFFVVAGIFGCSILAGMVLPNIFMLLTSLRYLLFFWIGFKLRQIGTGILYKIPAVIWLAASILLFVLAQYLDRFELTLLKILNVGVSNVSNIVGATMAFVILQKIAARVHWDNMYFTFLSKRSMSVYLLHQQAIYFFIYWLNGLVNPYLHAAINFVGSLVVSLVIASILMKFSFTRYLIGEK